MTTTAAEPSDPLLRRSPAVAVLSQGLPLAIGLASHALINLVDLAMVGRLGEDAVQSAHVGSTWNFLPMIVGQCISTALLSWLARRLGDGDTKGARALNRQAHWFMLWLGLAVSVLTALPAAVMVDGTGLTGVVRDDAVHYLVVSNLGCLPMFLLMQTTAAMRAAGEALMPLSLLLLANAINLLLAAVLLFGWPLVGVAPVGVVGAAYAAVAGRAVAAVLAFVWLRRRGHVLPLRAEAAAGQAPAVAWPLVRDAWPQMVQIGLRASIVLVLTESVVRRFGASATAALGITTRLDTLVLFASLGFANAATAYAGRAVMVGRVACARAAGLWAAVAAGALGAGCVLGMMQMAPQLVRWFVPDHSGEVVQVAALYLASAAWAQVAGAVALGAIGAVQGAGRMLSPLVVDLVGFTIAFVLLRLATGDGRGLGELFGALLAGMAVVAVLQVLFVLFGNWPTRRC
ncbi:MAG: MATE family efflux transporter [Planctomycetes bacterium]|nr:MATE family efflux transporter [Planctomycetota bacterium]